MITSPNKALFEIYCRLWPQLYKELKINKIDTVGRKISYPFLIHVFPEYDNAKTKLFVVGKQTNGWGWDGVAEYIGTSKWDDTAAKLDNHNLVAQFVEELTRIYVNFGRKSYGKPFLNAAFKLFEKLNPSSPNSNGWVWSDLVKVDQGGDRPDDLILNTVCTAFNVLPDEISIANPDVVVFFTSYTYDDILRFVFPGLKLQPVGNFNCEFLSRVEHNDLPKRSFRTYHPMPLQCFGQLENVINQIALWPSPISASNKPVLPAPKTNLRNQPIGTIDGNQELIAKCKDGEFQLWKSLTTGKFGVVRIVTNKYKVIEPCRRVEKYAREVFDKYCSDP